MIKTTYKANITKDGAFWFIQLSSLENVFAQACNVEELDSMTRDEISIMLDIPAESFDLKFNFESDKDIP